MIKYLLVFVLVCTTLACDIVVNSEPLVDSEPQLLKQVTNGQKFLIGDLKDPNQNYLYVANLKGTPTQMGKAFGSLFEQEIKSILTLFYGYYVGALEQILEKKIPIFMARTIGQGAQGLLKRILDLNILITKRYTNSRYYEEIKGIAEGAQIAEHDIARLNMFPELIKAACTVIGVWKTATLNGETLHLRALDWDAENPMSHYPLVAVYHPSDPKLQTHANFGWVGFVGSLTGMSTKVTLGEKVWLPPKGSVKMTRYGNPWTYVFRDILYEATDINSALAILTNARRTCAIHVGLGSKQDHSFRMFEYAEKVLNNYNDNNYTHYGDNHPKKEGVAYFDKHVQPSGDTCVGEILTHTQRYGTWTAEKLWRTVGFTHQTGDSQLAVFDLENALAFVSYASADGKHKAFTRSPIFLDMGFFFKDF